jgi:phosphohistidine swiveling domain-containing protein
MNSTSRIILDPKSAAEDAAWGGKGRALFRLSKAGFNIPEWFAISPDAYSKEGLSSELSDAIRAAAKELVGINGFLAVRSSAGDEDGTSHSFAGQLESFLYIAPDDVPGAVAKVWQSGFTERVLAYRREHNVAGLPRAPTVLVQRMIDAESAGVAFSADPVTGDTNTSVVSAVWGVGSALVSGEVDADTWHVSRDGAILKRYIACKSTAHDYSGAKMLSREIASQPALADTQIKEVADLACRCEKHFGAPQDIEWALLEGKIYLLQSRPITTIAKKTESEGAYLLWDNSNIAESYGGVTTPMTFSFARHAYDGVYRQFCKILGVSPALTQANEEIFPRMLGLIRGRVYYNLLNWYRLLAMLPGYNFNRGFMEQMMGVREALPEEFSKKITANAAPSSRAQKLADALRLAYSVLKILFNHFTLRRQIRRFYARLNTALGQGPVPLKEMRADQLLVAYRSLEKSLLSQWDAPLVNDFFAMIFYGSLRKTCEKWCNDGSLQNDLLAGEGGMISAEPARRLRTMGDMARNDPELANLLRDGSPQELETFIERRPTFAAEYHAYLDKFADRCLEELKLESPTLDDDPLLLLRSIGHLATADPAHHNPGAPATVRAIAELCVRERLRGHPVRRVIFNWVLRHARMRVRDRENLRFERTRVFGRVRRILLELGNRLTDQRVLDDARDVFYLELDEVLGFVEGTSTTTDLRGLASVRKAEFARHLAAPPPPSRFATRGIVPLDASDFSRVGSAHHSTSAHIPADTSDERKGIPCCPGRVRAQVCIIRDPRGATLPRGRILVAERTDPGWIMLFPSASGLLVERGSLLSHSAIVSRELGIPSIVSIPGLMSFLSDGDAVEMDGATGIIRRLKNGEEIHAQ